MDERQDNGLLLASLGVGIGALLGAAALMRVARRSRYGFRGKTVLITGGSRGLGLVMARQLASEGARLSLCARDPAELERAREDLRPSGAEVFTFPCDVTDREQVEAWVAASRDRLAPAEVLINNAGIIGVGPMETMLLSDYEQAMKTHFWGPLHTTLAVLPQMREVRRGRIVNVASIGGRVAPPHLLPYAASKFALVGLSEGLRAELLKDGILVTTVLPGLMRTGSPYNAYFKGQNEKEFAWFTLLDSLPGTSISAEGAARQILEACRRGDAEVVITALARFGVLFHGVFPGPTADLLGLVNQLLPAPGGIGTERALGSESRSELAPEALTVLSDRAALRNNEV